MDLADFFVSRRSETRRSDGELKLIELWRLPKFDQRRFKAIKCGEGRTDQYAETSFWEGIL